MSEKSDKQKSQTNEEQSQNNQNGLTNHFQIDQVQASSDYKQMYQVIYKTDLNKLSSQIKTLEDNNRLKQVLNEREQNYKQTLAYHIASSINFEFALKAMQIFKEKGALILINDFLGQSPFFYATRIGNIKLIKYFLTQNADINETDHYKQTPLFYAAREGNVEVAQIFIDNQANVNHKDLINQTPLFYAAREGKLKMCDLLLKSGANINEVDLKKQTALYYAKKFKRQEINDFLIKNGALDTKDGRITKTDKTKMKKSNKNEKTNNVSKKKKHKYKETQKFSYKLCLSTSAQDSNPLDKEQFKKFKEQYPFIAKILLNQEIALNSEEIMTKLREDNWKCIASKIVSYLWKSKNGNLFHEPVDPVALGIPTYFDIVKRPMDFSTVKKKISYNIYKSCNEYIEDMNQIFINCRLFNGVETHVGKIGVEFKKKFDDLLQQYQFNEKYQGQHFDFEEFLRHVFKKIQQKEEEERALLQNNIAAKGLTPSNQNYIFKKNKLQLKCQVELLVQIILLMEVRKMLNYLYQNIMI